MNPNQNLHSKRKLITKITIAIVHVSITTTITTAMLSLQTQEINPLFAPLA